MDLLKDLDRVGRLMMPSYPDDVCTLAKAEIERLTAEVKRLAAPIGMQDVRLVAGEGKLAAAHVLQAVNVILKQRRDRALTQQITTETK